MMEWIQKSEKRKSERYKRAKTKERNYKRAKAQKSEFTKERTLQKSECYKRANFTKERIFFKLSLRLDVCKCLHICFIFI